MLAIVAIESHRHRCMVDRRGPRHGGRRDARGAGAARRAVVPAAVLRDASATADFTPPAAYPPRMRWSRSARTTSRTLAGWWTGRRPARCASRWACFPIQAHLRQAAVGPRAGARASCCWPCSSAGLLSRRGGGAGAPAPSAVAPRTVEAAHAFLASAPSALMMVQLEDAVGRGRAGQHARHDGRAPQLAAQAARPTCGSWPAASACAALGEALACGAAAPGANRAGRSASRGVDDARACAPPTGCSSTRTSASTTRSACCPYLAKLGVSHVYCSPIQRARAGQHARLRRGGARRDQPRARRRGRLRALRRGADARTAWASCWTWCPTTWACSAPTTRGGWTCWRTAPRRSTRSTSTSTGSRSTSSCTGKVLLPVLGDHYGDVLDERRAGAAPSRTRAAAWRCTTTSTAFRWRPRRYPRVLQRRRVAAGRRAALVGQPGEHSSTSFGHLPGRDATDAAGAVAERARDKELLKTPAGAAGSRASSTWRRPSRRRVAEHQRCRASAMRCTRCIEVQAYRLAFWRVAADEINYRRFFDINELAALRMEREAVFEATQVIGARPGRRRRGRRPAHRPPRRPLRPGRSTSTSCRKATRDAPAWCCPSPMPRAAAPGRSTWWPRRSPARTRKCPVSWHVHGTTGYRFANVANGVLVDTEAEASGSQRIWRSFTGVRDSPSRSWPCAASATSCATRWRRS